MTAYYNEIDEYAAQWLRNLIAAGHIAPGDVDTRSITEVHPDDIKNYTQCHFFAGIGVWSHALRRAGWSDSRPVWTGSCPCQPFSVAGKGDGFNDDRHLWPVFADLIRQRKPPIVFGEQVASKDADAWIDAVQDDLEAMGYAVGAVAFPSAGVGAPHIRDRMYWVGHSGGARLEGFNWDGRNRSQPGWIDEKQAGSAWAAGGFSRVVFAAECDEDGNCPQCGDDFGDCECIGPTEDDVEYIERDGVFYGRRLADTDSDGCQSRIITSAPMGYGNPAWSNGSTDDTGPIHGFWRDADWLLCRDGKWRPVEPGTFPLADGASGRVGRLRAYGNAICAEAAVEFIKVAMEYRP